MMQAGFDRRDALSPGSLLGLGCSRHLLNRKSLTWISGSAKLPIRRPPAQQFAEAQGEATRRAGFESLAVEREKTIALLSRNAIPFASDLRASHAGVTSTKRRASAS